MSVESEYKDDDDIYPDPEQMIAYNNISSTPSPQSELDDYGKKGFLCLMLCISLLITKEDLILNNYLAHAWSVDIIIIIIPRSSITNCSSSVQYNVQSPEISFQSGQ